MRRGLTEWKLRRIWAASNPSHFRMFMDMRQLLSANTKRRHRVGAWVTVRNVNLPRELRHFARSTA